MSSNTVHVKNISHDTSEKEVRDFFSFWSVQVTFVRDYRVELITDKLVFISGKITSLSVTPSSDSPQAPQSATVNFEKETLENCKPVSSVSSTNA